jgi:hypothetical protein
MNELTIQLVCLACIVALLLRLFLPKRYRRDRWRN